MTKKLLVIHGPNINLLGSREPDIYGDLTLDALNTQITEKATALGFDVTIIQSNNETEIIESLHQHRDHNIVINPAAFTHTSIAIRDALAAVEGHKVEVHISNVHARESFRHTSYTAGVCDGQISGLGEQSYLLAIDYLSRL